MSLGDNEELGGTVRGGAVRWKFFTDATVPGVPPVALGTAVVLGVLLITDWRVRRHTA